MRGMLISPKTAQSLPRKNFFIEWFSKIIEKYLDNDDYFKNHFLQLKNHKTFSDIVQMSRTETKDELQVNYEDSTSNKIFKAIIKDLANYEHRIGIRFQELIKDKLNENPNNYYKYPDIEFLGSGDCLLNETDIIKSFSSNKTIKLINGYFQANNDNGSPLPATIIAKTRKGKTEFIFEYMNDIISTAIAEFVPNSNINIKEVYISLVNSYKNWLPSSGSFTTIRSLQAHYNKINDILSELFSKNEQDENEPDQNITAINNNGEENEDIIIYNEFLRELITIVNEDAIKSLKSYYNKLQKLNYKGKGFPIFPGCVRNDAVEQLPPISSGHRQYLIPAMGNGWQKESNALYYLLSLLEFCSNMFNINEINNHTSLKELFITLKQELIGYFELLGINRVVVNFTSYNALTNIISKKSDPLGFYKNIITIASQKPEVLYYDCIEDKKATIKLKISPINNYLVKKQKVLFLINSTKNEFDLMQHEDKNILPEFLTALFCNSGIWPKSFEIYQKKFDFEFHKDKLWEKNSSILRWFKATIDGIVLKLILNGEIHISFKDTKNSNSLNKLENNEYLLIIPLLLRDNKNTEVHSYYFDILETIKSLVHLEGFNSINGDAFLSRRISLSKKELQKDFINNLHTPYSNDNLGNQITIQQFNFIPKMPDINNKYKIWFSTSENIKQEIFNNLGRIGYRYTRVKSYSFTIKNMTEDVYLLGYTKKDQANEKIIPELFFVDKLLSLGKTMNKLFSPLLSEINAGTKTLTDLKNYFDDITLKSTIKNLPGMIVKPESKHITLLPILLVTASSLRRTAGLMVNFEKYDKKKKVIPLNLKYEKFFTFYSEGYTIEGSSQDPERLFRIYLILYEKGKPPQLMFDEFFYASKDKIAIQDYRGIIFSSLFKPIYYDKIPILISIKNMERSATELRNISDSATDNDILLWKSFKEAMDAYFDESNDSKPNIVPVNEQNATITPHLWGYIKDFVTIPELYFSKSNNPRIFEFSFKASFDNNIENNQYEDYQVLVNLILKGSKKSDLIRIQNEKDEKSQQEANKELKSRDFYAHANALVNFQKLTNNVSEDFKKEIFDLHLLGSSIGDEMGELSLAGFDRLFIYPHPDSDRRIFGPSLLIKGIDFYAYRTQGYK